MSMRLHLYTTQQYLKQWQEGYNIYAWTKESSQRPADATFHIDTEIGQVEFGYWNGAVKLIQHQSSSRVQQSE